MKNNITKILIDLIKFETTSDKPEELVKCIDYIESLMKSVNLKTKRYTINSKPSLIAARTIKKRYQYILNGHIDVVPANYKDAFKPKVISNKLYGRGAMDMKDGIAAMCQLMIDYAKRKENIDIALMITSDEEIGGFNGVKYLLEKEGYKADCAIIPDSGSFDKLTIEEKGIMHVKITSTGKSAHGSRPWLGNNAILKLFECYKIIKNNIPDTKETNRWKPTVNLGKIQGGSATNNVPDYAEMYLDFRYTDKKFRQEIISILKTSCKIDNLSYNIEVEGLPLNNDLKNHYVKKAIATGKKNGINFGEFYCHGASDARFFSEINTPVIMFRPKSSEAHADNEWVDLKSLNKFYEILKDFLFD